MKDLISNLHISDSTLINAIIVMAVIAVIAALTSLLITKVLSRFSKFTKTELDDKIIRILHRPVLASIILPGLLYTFVDIIEKSTFNIVSNITYSLLTIIWTLAANKLVSAVFEHSAEKVFDITGLKKDVLPLFEMISKISFLSAAILIIMSIWSIDIKPILASAGIVSIVIALAAKDALSNLIGGISVFLDKPFKIGDYIELDNSQRGEVVDIGMRSTRIKTRDDILISIPNSIIANSQIVNESAPIELFRIRIPVSIAYGSDIHMVEKVLNELANQNVNVVADPAPRVRFRKFGDWSLEFELLCWAKQPAMRGLTTHELNCVIYDKFNELGIKIPFPQHDIHIKNDHQDKL